MPRRKQQAPRRSAGNARGRAVGSGPGSGRWGRGRAGAAGDTPPGGRGIPKLGGGRAPARARARSGNLEALREAGTGRGGQGGRGRGSAGASRYRGRGGGGKRSCCWAAGVRWKSPPRAGRLNLTLENKVTSLGRKECGRRISLENSSL